MPAHTPAQLARLQRALNDFNHAKGLGRPRVIPDGETGPLTRNAIKAAKHDLGYPRERNTIVWGAELTWRLSHPRSAGGPHAVPAAEVRQGKRRRERRRAAIAAHHAHAVLKPGVGHYDGVPVARQFIPYLQWARTHHVNGRAWQGRLVSGWRAPWYSEGLCRQMCGAPSCPGKCAGRASRHSQVTIQGGAVDVSDYVHFAAAMRACPLRPRIHNALPRDLVHFSVAGN